MNGLIPYQPNRPLLWPDIVLDIQESLPNTSESVYIVGGAVRDAMLHRPIHDLDLAVDGDSIGLARYIANRFKGAFFIMDNERGVARTLLDTPDGRLMVDVARFRGATLHEDLTERDFTVNAMAVDLKGDLTLLIDPLGGESDLASKQLRRCTPHALSSDPARILRAVRQSAQFGLRIEPETLRDARAAIPNLSSTSPERIRDELMKLLSLPRAAAAVRVADALGLLGAVLPETIPLHGLKQPPPHVFDAWEHTLSVIENLTGILATISYTRTDNTAASFSFGIIAMQLDPYRKQLYTHIATQWPNERSHQALLILAALLHNAAKPFLGTAVSAAKLADARADALRLSNAERQRIAAVIQHYSTLLPSMEWTPVAIHRYWRQLGDAGVDTCLLALADYLGIYGSQLEQNSWLGIVERVRVLLEAFYEKHDQLVSPPTLLDGSQLVALLQLKPGPLIGQLLDAIREAQVQGLVQNIQDALDLAQAVIDDNTGKS
jgi:tRNA nucleotidyltransferase/poly(A) polymerase